MTIETPMKIVVDLSLPKGQRESIIELTAEEIAERELQAAQTLADQELEEAIQAEKDALKLSAIQKLAALGLSDAEIYTLVS